MKMFRSKKENKFTDKPQPPTWEQMEEDLKLATKNDVLFSVGSKQVLIEGKQKKFLYDKNLCN